MNIISVQTTFKIHFRCGNLPLFSGVIAVPSGPKSHTFTVILAVQDGIINCEKSYALQCFKAVVAIKGKFSKSFVDKHSVSI